MTLIEKLKAKPGTIAIINSPKELLGEFKTFKPSASIPAGARESFDFVLLFATHSKGLAPAWKQITRALKQDGILWIASPKKSSGIPTDLGMGGDAWEFRKGSPWQPVTAISIDDKWSGTRYRFAPDLEQKREDRQSEEVRDTDGALVLDRVNRAIFPPKDLAAVLARHPEAEAFFDQLSFTNRKEYVMWVVEAKRPETRANRVTAALEKLVSGKKNPAEK